MTVIRCPLEEAAGISGAQPAILREGLELSYREYHGAVTRTAAAMAAQGFSQGEPVGIFLQPDWNYPVLLMALLRLGAVACPLDVRLPREQLRSAVASLGCERLIGVTRGGERSKSLWGLTVFTPEGLLEGGQARSEPAGPCRVDLDRRATILHTSGSHGFRKAVVHSYGNHYYSAVGSNANIKVHSGDRWLLSLPLSHVSGLSILFRCLLGGGAVVIPRPTDSLVDSITEHKITHLSLVPTQLRELLGSGISRATQQHVKSVLVGGAATPDGLLAQAHAMHWPVYTTYGLTEMASQVTTTHRATPPRHRATSGQPLKYREVRLAADGEIQVRGRTRFMGYLENDELTTPFDSEGWFSTGDLGVLTEDGYLTVTGRRDNMFLSGGENIVPEEIEAALLSLDGVEQAVVVPVPDARFGERPVAFVRGGTDAAGPGGLKRLLEPLLPRYKLPQALYDWPVEAGAGLKVDRLRLRAIAVARQTPGAS